MRRFLLLALMLLPLPALAEDTPYLNARFGYEVGVPADFALLGEAGNGDGRTYSKDGATLAIWGHTLAAGPFEQEVADRLATYRQEGWDIGYERQTAGWASLSGTRGGAIFYHRVIRLCDDAVASFVLEYPDTRKAEFSPVVGRLVKSLRPAGGCTNAQGTAPTAQ